jgi:hypothetical protein
MRETGTGENLPRDTVFVNLRSFLEISFADHIESVSANFPREDFVALAHLIVPPDGAYTVVAAIVTKYNFWGR